MNRKLFIILAATCMMQAACGGSRSRINAYTDPSFDSRSVKSVAILPMRNSQISYGDAISINRSIQQEIARKRPDLLIVGSEDAVKLINESGLADEYTSFLTSYYTSGIPNSNTLKKLGKALNAETILQGGILNVYQSDGDGWGRKGTANVTIKYGMISTKSGGIIWDATAECQSWTATELEQSPSVMDTVGPAINKIFAGFPLVGMEKVLQNYKTESEKKEEADQNGRGW